MRNHIITPCNSISSHSCAVPCRRESRIMRGGLYMYAKRHRLNACSTARDTYTRKKTNGRSEKTGVCMRPQKNRLWHVFRYASPEGLLTCPWHILTPDQSRSVRKGSSLYVAKQKWIVCGGSYMYSDRHRLNGYSNAPDTHTRKNQNGRSQTAGVCMRPKKIWLCAANYMK